MSALCFFFLGENKRVLATLRQLFCSILLMAPEDHFQSARRGLSANDFHYENHNTNNRKRERFTASLQNIDTN